MYLFLFLIPAIAFCGYFQHVNTLTFTNYGSYKTDWKYYCPCKGPKSKNLTFVTTSLEKTIDNKYVTGINITFLSTSQVEEMKIELYRETDSKILLWNYKVKNLCKNIALGPLLIEQFNTDSRCIIRKGTYNVKFNVSDLTKTFLGSQFFYGNFVSKVTISAKKGNLCCLTQGISFTKATDV